VNFLNVGPWELIVIFIIAILLVGPKRMVEMARTIGRVSSQMRRMSAEFLGTIRDEVEAVEADARQALEGVVQVGEDSVAELQATEQETRQVLESIGEDRRRATTSIKAELQAVEHETRQALEEIVENVGGMVRGEREATEEGEDEEASRE
jgi:sec-independent protein translocase protein TatB